MEKELRRHAGRPIAGLDLGQPEPERALAALAEVRSSIDELDGIAGRLARSAAAHGASWADVASSLRMTSESARAAYEHQP